MQQYICVITCENCEFSKRFVKEARFFDTFEDAVCYGSSVCSMLKPLKSDYWIYEYSGYDSLSATLDLSKNDPAL